ncbi:MAG: Nre family DNA repair protein [Archaeoglobaceae archaeon]|nr:Nre family DNA repair protein [Archaeoglobaceae archaeon]MDW7989750.1 Nre family DNA repair protein [Archaeoglobaceae archaeon]
MDEKLCIICRGRVFCGRSCRAFDHWLRISYSTEIFGSSPPAIFVGKNNYPEVFACPALPPFTGDTEIYDKPEFWRDLSIEEILNLRYSLILGQFRVNVKKPNPKILELIQELSLYEKPVDMELKFEKPPKPKIFFDDRHAPFGPFAPARTARICGPSRVPEIIEKVYEENKISAVDAIKMLYERKIAVSHIQKLLSAGSLGKKRKLVPTRWAITAVDDTISKLLIEEVREFQVIDDYQVFVHKKARNLFIAILIPRIWSFEWGEAWFPETTWNFGNKTVIECDSEDHNGRNDYATLGGCYYSARLATVEHLKKMRRQASAILWREIYPGFKLPIGVWFVREMLREMFLQKPVFFETLEEVFDFLSNYSQLIEDWKRNSKLLKKIREQKMLCHFS